MTVGSCAKTGGGPAKTMTYENDHFYKPDGTFDQDAALAAYYEMMERFGYPIPERLRGEDLWTLDFGLGKFTEVGMAGIFWINHVEHDYLGHEIYLLPNQMIPEHSHVATETVRAKVEGWHLRHGSVTLFAEGTPTPGVDEIIPPSHRDIAVARTMTKLECGEYGTLANPEERHWMMAGPEGAIVSEYASAQDMDGLRFTHPDITL
jgi:D-lyxose ketol-isomerase